MDVAYFEAIFQTTRAKNIYGHLLNEDDNQVFKCYNYWDDNVKRNCSIWAIKDGKF